MHYHPKLRNDGLFSGVTVIRMSDYKNELLYGDRIRTGMRLSGFYMRRCVCLIDVATTIYCNIFPHSQSSTLQVVNHLVSTVTVGDFVKPAKGQVRKREDRLL